MSDDYRRDYGPAGCAEGCATRGSSLLLVMAALTVLVRGVARAVKR